MLQGQKGEQDWWVPLVEQLQISRASSPTQAISNQGGPWKNHFTIITHRIVQ